jgi:hypothetical protein
MMVLEHDGLHSSIPGFPGRLEIIDNPVEHRGTGMAVQITGSLQKFQISTSLHLCSSFVLSLFFPDFNAVRDFHPQF